LVTLAQAHKKKESVWLNNKEQWLY
jgi:hypothetical protein